MSTVSYLQEVQRTLQARLKLARVRHPLAAIEQALRLLPRTASSAVGAQQALQDVNMLYLLAVAARFAEQLARPALLQYIEAEFTAQRRRQARLPNEALGGLRASAETLADSALQGWRGAQIEAAADVVAGGWVCDGLRDLYEELLALEWIVESGSGGALKRTNARRRKQGAYYTPLPVARGMADRVLTPILAGCRDTAAVLNLRIVDPMMGPGVFLQAAGERLAARAAALSHDLPAVWWSKVAAQCLYGIDLDGDAAQVGRIGLAFLSGAAATEIHCVAGNSLVGSVEPRVNAAQRVDKQLAEIRAARLPIRTPANSATADSLPEPIHNFARLFPEVFGGEREGRAGWNGARLTGGFDALLSNPPYVSFYSRDSAKKGGESLEEAYFNHAGVLDRELPAALRGRTNLFLLALFAGEQFLCREVAGQQVAGRAGWLLPDTFLSNESYSEWRRWFLETHRLEAVEWIRADLFGEPSLGSAGVYFGRAAADGVAVELIEAVALETEAGRGGDAASGKRRGRPKKSIAPGSTATAAATLTTAPATRAAAGERFGVAEILSFPHLVIPTMARGTRELVARIEKNSIPITSWMQVRDGVNPGPREFRDRILLDRPDPADGTVRPLIVGGDIEPFRLRPVQKWIRHNPALLTPAIKKQGASFRAAELFSGPKIVSRQTASHPIAALDLEQRSAINSVHIMIPAETLGFDAEPACSLLMILGVLNAQPLTWYYRQRWMENRRVFPQVHISSLRQLPIPAVLREAARAKTLAGAAGAAIVSACAQPAQAAWQAWVRQALGAAAVSTSVAGDVHALLLEAWGISPAAWKKAS